ncbi:TonB-dependent siderophore receptor [Bordetella genomosp. 12]|uniref:Fe(3+)-pyochelin receptor 3 n=1 Tax=Bordetella genomosp. 12 TaxID=463035 RepID=A0A261VUY4_9BORD|nr:TonB-dependent siderophore receptor [Bordetella genomosp. 12]OZI77312.1 Fe(3+)-pyochelin receptor 3 [Bordetella genomosp. 12]
MASPRRGAQRANAYPVARTPRLPLIRHLPVAVAAALALTLPPMAQAQPAPAAAVQYDIAAGPLAPALSRYAQQSGAEIVLDVRSLDGLRTEGLRGSYGVDEGFAALLRGTGYRANKTAVGYVLVPDPQTRESVSTLEAVRVEGRHNIATEGTGSYAARGVSLTKGADSLREIPQSVSVMTRQQMDDQGMNSVADALSYVTGMTASDYEGTEKFSARGFSTSAQYDGLPQQDYSPHMDLAIYDRVEILRGPSGLLTGTGEPGGVINYVRKRPLDVAHFSASTTVGSWDHRRIEADGGGPLNESGTLRGRLVGAYEAENKFYDYGRTEPTTFYGVLEYDLTPDTTVGLTATYNERRFRNFNGLPLYADDTLPSRDDYVGPSRMSKDNTYDVGMDVTHRLGGGWELSAAYMHRDTRYRGYSAFASAPLDVATGRSGMYVGRIANDFKWDQGDIHVSGPVHLLGRDHILTVGYNYARYDSLTGSRFSVLSDVEPLNDHDFNALYELPVLSKSKTITTQYGLYTTGRFKLADPLTLVLGGRWTDYAEKSRDVSPDPSDYTRSAADVNNKFTPFGGLIWDVSKQVSVYASYADIFVPQTEKDYNEQTLKPRVGWQTEAGIKGEFFDKRLNASLAFFRIRDQNRAMLDESHVGCDGTLTGSCYRSAGKVQSQGWEAEISGSPSPGWDIAAGYTYTNAKYLQDSNPDNVGQRFGADVLPRHLFKLWTQYRFNGQDFGGALLGWRIGAGVQAQSDVYTSSMRQGGYMTVSARLGYQISKNWDAALSVNNLFNREYLRTPGYGIFYNIYGAPRSAMLTLRYAM